MTTAALP